MKTIFLAVLLIHIDLSDSFVFKRRRRAPQPVPKDCVLSEWRTVVACSESCGPSGIEIQQRRIVVEGRNGGKPCSDYELDRTVACNRVCYNEGQLNESEGRCDCPAGYTGDCCDQDVNECNNTPPPCDQVCVNTMGSYHCDCRENYTLDTDNVHCVDAKECQRTPPPCAHRCKELDGGYSCYCEAGYELDADKTTCNDINECKRGSICQYQCINTPGDYECRCQSGYFRNSDNKTCTDIDECVTLNGGCKQTCENLVGGFRCRCAQGYVLADDNISCNDLDECATHGTTLCEQTCINIPGSYTCGCIKPYTLNPDQRTCSCEGDEFACKAAREQAERVRNTGGDRDTVYNWIIGVLILVCLVLLMALALLCYRKGYYRMLVPKPPPISTIPRRHNNVVFTPDIVDEDASGVYEDPDDMHYEVLPEGPAYMELTEPNCKQEVENKPTAEENHYVDTEYCQPDSPSSLVHHTHLRKLSSSYVPLMPAAPSPARSDDGPTYVDGDNTGRPVEAGYSSRNEMETSGYSSRAEVEGGFDHEEDDYQNNPPFYDNI